MEHSKAKPDWDPTSFSGVAETGDSLSQSNSAQPASDDQSLDNTSREKLNMTEQTTLSKKTTDTPISMFEDDTRSSWSGEPPKQTPLVDYELGNSNESSECSQNFTEAQEEFPKDETDVKTKTEAVQDSELIGPQEASQESVTIKPSEDKENAVIQPIEVSSESDSVKPQDESQGSVSIKLQDSVCIEQLEESQDNISVKPQDELQEIASVIPVENSQENIFAKPQEDSPDVDMKPLEEESADNTLIPPRETESTDVIMESQEELQDIVVTKTQEKHQDNVSIEPKEKVQDVFPKPQVDAEDNVFVKPQDISKYSVFTKPKEMSKDNVFIKPQIKESQDSVTKPQEEGAQDVEMIEVPVEANKWESSNDSQTNTSSPEANLKEPKTNGIPKPSTEKDDVFLKPSDKSAKIVAVPKEPTEEEKIREFPPEKLFEYMWPQQNGEFFMLQEQISEYLGLKSFRRKYQSKLTRRNVEMEEKQFLREKNVVTEMQCDLGLTALKSDEVLELMSKEYPSHYAEYIKVLRERQQKNITEKHKEFVATNSDKNKMNDLVRKAMKSAAEYNAHLNQERREERRSCMDLQTYTIHYPKSNKPKPEVNTKMGKYPVALLPGQFQDYYKEYTSDELKYLPVNTVLYGPLKELQGGEVVSSESEDSSASDKSCSSSSDDDSSSESEDKGSTKAEPEYKPKVKPNAVCKTCKKGSSDPNKDELVHCADCDNSAHPACIELSPEVVEVLRTYPWQCTDCKVCSQCRNPDDEDKMLFCDTCDRGYHTFCVGLKALPMGKWVCRRCGTCSGCGATQPGDKAQWNCEGGESGKAPKILCQNCFKGKKR